MLTQEGIAGHVASDQYGKFGIIREADLASKVSEFQQWAHRKYYDLMAYAREKAVRAAKKGKDAGVSLVAVKPACCTCFLAAVVALCSKMLQPFARPSSAAIVHNCSHHDMS